MSKLERSRLLDFLSKPHYKREIAEHFSVPATYVNQHLQEAVKSGQVLVSEKPVVKTTSKSRGAMVEKIEDFLYISRNSRFLVDNLLKMNVSNVGRRTSKPDNHLIPIKFLPTSPILARSKSLKHRNSTYKLKETDSQHSIGRGQPKESLISRFFDSLTSKMKLAHGSVRNKRLRYKTPPNRSERKSLSYMEKLRLFKTLSNKPLPFLEIHKHFAISKQTITRFVEKGLLEEKWGPKDIGVKYRLTKKGRAYLRQLEAATHLESTRWKSIFIRLKMRTHP